MVDMDNAQLEMPLPAQTHQHFQQHA
jgi:hypothetical protein